MSNPSLHNPEYNDPDFFFKPILVLFLPLLKVSFLFPNRAAAFSFSAGARRRIRHLRRLLWQYDMQWFLFFLFQWFFLVPSFITKTSFEFGLCIN